MFRTPLTRIERITSVRGDGTQDLLSLARSAAAPFKERASEIGGVIAASFSNSERFPALSIRLAGELGLAPETPAFDLQMACSAYPYAVYLAGRLAADTGRKVLVVDGDVQTPFVDAADPATGSIFSDAVTCSLVSSAAESEALSSWDFLSRTDEALTCRASGPIRMDGMRVFTFVATEVRAFLEKFLGEGGDGLDFFAPHQANPYMVRQLAKSLNLQDRLLTLPEEMKNPGSCSIPLTLHETGAKGRVLIAGFGAGYSAAAGIVEVI